jgi:hypothetical protein
MDTRADRAAELNRAMGRRHRAVLATLVVCGVLILASGLAEANETIPPRNPAFTLVAVGLAVGSIVARRASLPRDAKLRSFIFLNTLSLLLAGCIGLLGVAVALGPGRGITGLFYALAGLLLSARRPPQLPTASAGEE